ncbi:LiaI-LiaF-like domain-containing protein [Lederbergia citrea]|uniref:LiaI-LiaF-like transmembrane region domain-containing protein n=1 Tax=Lederbergia citrea TaxID=2833581 RepID=A0A942UNJ1_9BACI|nr:DUF5668 domain-containing protein [Lederbergia citrea]MBS4176170.1 hypothetical protein [Lederbergia citrea]MBS4202730.1 hypothetical protein [Lederbergia citrea]MBS4222602.1 hypothetical protein [Lederbergia citrea]
MKKQTFFTGVILIGFGLYFLFQQFHFTLLADFYTWPTLLIIVGVGFLAQGYLGRLYDFILPGVVLTGIGIHFHIASKLDVWPDHSGIFLLLIALGLFLKYVKTGAGLFQGILFFAAAILLLFFDRLADWAGRQGYDFTMISNIWPYFFIALGAYFLFVQRK